MEQKKSLHVVHSKDDIQKNISELAEKLNKQYKDKQPIVICILNGAVLFFSDLVKKLNFKLKMDFIGFSSYHENKQTDKVVISKELKYDLQNQDIILVEDMVDSGNTMQFALQYFNDKKVNSIKLLSLIGCKELKEKLQIKDFEYFYEKQPNSYYVGYGLDNNEFDRQIEDICVLKQNNQINLQQSCQNEQQDV